MSALRYDVVVPTAGRKSLPRLLAALAAADGPRPGHVLVVHDVERRGPATARNQGWRSSDADWIAFLDDDVVPDRDWARLLERDLARLPDDVAGSQGRVRVPRPSDRRPTDWERNVMGLETARWATADMAYRRSALAAVGGFDERFPRAYREDADLALRLRRAGFRLVEGRRRVTHPVRPADFLVSVRAQAGNADDALMRVLHGRRWRAEAAVPRGRFPTHVATVAAGVVALSAIGLRRRRLAAVGLAGWLLGTGELAYRRIAPGPRTRREASTMVVTSALLPPAAVYHRLRGEVRALRVLRRSRPDAVLLDRDGTLIVDIPDNGDPALVEPMPGARAALDRLREARIPLGVVSNQGGVAAGRLTALDLERVNSRVEELLGPVDAWAVCMHGPDERCACRKPAPGLVHRAATELGARPERCVVIGDIGTDIEAARAAGARGILVPTPVTRRAEIWAADEVAPTLGAAVDRLLGGRGR